MPKKLQNSTYGSSAVYYSFLFLIKPPKKNPLKRSPFLKIRIHTFFLFIINNANASNFELPFRNFDVIIILHTP